jgi:hypothetical protein
MISTATLGEKKANVKREVVFALLSPPSLRISMNVPKAIHKNYSSHLLSNKICGLRNPVETVTETRLIIQWFTHTSAAAGELISGNSRKCYTSEHAPPA